MTVCFSKDGHKIIVKKSLSAIQLIIDGNLYDEETNFFKVQNCDYELKGLIKSSEKIVGDVLVQFKHGFFIDEVTLFYNGVEIETKHII